ncbi:MAG: plasmid replication initiator TrfA [Burkholderiaceae bacterium]
METSQIRLSFEPGLTAVQRAEIRASIVEARRDNPDLANAEQLVLWHDWERAMPTVVSRSALFSPIGKGRRQQYVDAVIDSRTDVILTYTGQQLDMSDADVFMQVLEMAKRFPLGTRFKVNRAQLLTAIGRSYQSKSSTGKIRKSAIGDMQYQWLDEVLDRLRVASLKFEFKKTLKRKAYGGRLNLIHTWLWDDGCNSYVLSIEPEIKKLFQNFSRIYLEKHLALPKSDQLAKWMHLYVAGCKKYDEVKIGLDCLRAWSGNKHRRLDHFHVSMLRSLRALADTGIIAQGCFIRTKDSMVHFTRIV